VEKKPLLIALNASLALLKLDNFSCIIFLETLCNLINLCKFKNFGFKIWLTKHGIKIMRRYKSIAIYIFSFGFARGMLFFSPILLANLLPRVTYGIVEYSHATGTFCATIFGFGTAAVLPLIVLGKSQSASVISIYFHYLMLTLACVVGFFISLFYGASFSTQLTFLMTIAIALQALLSIQFKTIGRGELALFLDAGVFLVFVTTAGVYKIINVGDVAVWIFYSVCFYIAILACWCIKFLKEDISNLNLNMYFSTLKLGMPLMIGAFVTIAIMSGRLITGYLGGAILTADYAVLARTAALPMAAHQVLLGINFQKLYTITEEEIESFMLKIIGMVSVFVVSMWSLAPYLDWIFGNAFAKAYRKDSFSGVMILFQSILWSGIALNDFMNTRQNKAKNVLPWSLTYLIVSLPLAFFVIKMVGISLEKFVLVHSTVMFFFYFLQSIAMYCNGVDLKKVWIFTGLIYLVLSTIAIALWLHLINL